MKRLIYGLTTLVIGTLIHLIFNRYLSHFGVGPQLLLLFVVAHGFLAGPIMGESLGFFWGLMMDAMGVSFFGIQTLLFSVAGYVSGKLRRRVASERPTAQIFISLATTFFYFGGAWLVRTVLEDHTAFISVWKMLFGAILNLLFVMAIFWVVEWWLQAWQIEEEHF